MFDIDFYRLTTSGINTTDEGTHLNQFITHVFFADLYIQGIQRYVREYQS